MANNKYAGFQPKKDGVEAIAQLDKFNPYEFRKGMDFELTSMGCARLAESTIEEREKATETVLKNLGEHQSYYSGLIQYTAGMNQAGKINEKTFKKYLEENFPNTAGTGMQCVKKEFKKDKMTEPKYDKAEYTKEFKTDLLKEAIKKEIKNILEFSETPEEAKKAAKKAKKDNKAADDKEKKDNKDSVTTAKGKAEKIKDLEDEIQEEKDKIASNKKEMAPHLQAWNSGAMEADAYRKETEKEVEENKKSIARIKEIEKEIDEVNLTEKLARREVAKTMMEKETHLEILGIIREAGVNLREGADGIKMYYEIAKTAYQEGIIEGMRKITEEHK